MNLRYFWNVLSKIFFFFPKSDKFFLVSIMNLYYKNETLFIDIDIALNEENIKCLKQRIFRIVDDYDIDHIILSSSLNNIKYKTVFQQIKLEYNQKYNGSFFIK